MTIKSLVPRTWGKKGLAINREEDNPFYSLQRAVDHVFDNFFGEFGLGPFSLDRRMGSFSPRIDVSEADREFQVTVELPGLDEKDVEVSLANNFLTLKGEKKEEKEEKRKDYYSKERSYGMFERSIPIPEGIDLDKIEASFKKGVLKVTLPKSVEYQKERKSIPIKAA